MCFEKEFCNKKLKSLRLMFSKKYNQILLLCRKSWCIYYNINHKISCKPEGEEPELVLGSFQGKPACIRIPWGKGVCGTAAQQDRTQLIPDVHAFPGHIACDSASNAEIVIPIHGKDGTVTAVLDIDSPLRGRFDEADREGLEKFVRVLEEYGEFGL